MRTLTVALAALALSAAPAAAKAAIYIFDAILTGPNEFPPVPSPGTGTGHIVFDDIAHTMSVDIDFAGLLFPTTVAHIHAPTDVAGVGLAGVATTTPSFPGFPAGVTSGSYAATFDMSLASSYRAGFLTL
ncbi:MAG: CHRD domain-containing protein, partial [Dehalococcoidia bacterium]|nr:CHRD domain-containing protein [Dehalococcoidia bacterium]